MKRDHALRIYLEDLEDTAFKTLKLLRGFQIKDESDGGVKVDIKEQDQFEYDQEENESEEADGNQTGTETRKTEEKFGEILDNDDGEEKEGEEGEVGKKGCVESGDGKGDRVGVVEKETPRRDWWND
jgi:hypothetical protein